MLRRCLGLFVLGVLHGLLLWAGDILTLYAVLGVSLGALIRSQIGAIMLIGLACLVGSALLCARIVGQLMPSAKWAPAIAAFAASLCYPVIFWSLRGMEVGFLLVMALALTSATITLADQAAAEVPAIRTYKPSSVPVRRGVRAGVPAWIRI